MELFLPLWIAFSAFYGFAYGGCNEKIMAKPDQVTYITSPGYPGNFTQYVDCYYEMYTSSEHPGLLVYVDVVDVTLSCDDDTTHLQVYEAFSRNPRYLGRICEGGQVTFESPRQSLYLTFKSRTLDAGRSRGFRLRVRTMPKYCHCYTQETAVLEVTSSPALLSSPYYPYGTEPNVNCRWLLKAPSHRRINVTLLHTDMKGSSDCHNFGLYLYDGKTSYDDKPLASVCRNSAQSLQSSGPYLLVVFTSGPMVFRSGGGVKLQYTSIPYDGGDKQVISQTMFYVITCLLMLLIVIIVAVAVVKLFVLPKRRKQSERRRRNARARLTRVSRSSSQSERSSIQSEAGGGGADTEAGVGRSGRRSYHASCSRMSSAISGTSVGSQNSGLSLNRLLSLYGLKKCRQEHRCSTYRSGHSPDCVHGGGGGGGRPRRTSSSSGGVVIRVPGYSLYDTLGAGGLPSPHPHPHPPPPPHDIDLPPSYEEAIGHEVVRGHGVEVTGSQTQRSEVEVTRGQDQGRGRDEVVITGGQDEVRGQRVEEVTTTEVAAEGQGQSQDQYRDVELGLTSSSSPPGGDCGGRTLGEVTEHAVVTEVLSQTSLEHAAGQSSSSSSSPSCSQQTVLEHATGHSPSTSPSSSSFSSSSSTTTTVTHQPGLENAVENTASSSVPDAESCSSGHVGTVQEPLVYQTRSQEVEEDVGLSRQDLGCQVVSEASRTPPAAGEGKNC